VEIIRLFFLLIAHVTFQGVNFDSLRPSSVSLAMLACNARLACNAHFIMTRCREGVLGVLHLHIVQSRNRHLRLGGSRIQRWQRDRQRRVGQLPSQQSDRYRALTAVVPCHTSNSTNSCDESGEDESCREGHGRAALRSCCLPGGLAHRQISLSPTGC